MATATAHPNFALIKYWGKASDRLNLPAAGSISVTVEELVTRTSVRFNPKLKQDVIYLNNAVVQRQHS